MKYGLDIPTAGTYADPRKLADLAAEAEEAGWDGFFLLMAQLLSFLQRTVKPH